MSVSQFNLNPLYDALCATVVLLRAGNHLDRIVGVAAQGGGAGAANKH